MLRLLWDVQTLSAAHRRVAAAPLILQDALPFVPNPGWSPGVVLEVCALTHTVRDRHPFSYQDDVREVLPRHRAKKCRTNRWAGTFFQERFPARKCDRVELVPDECRRSENRSRLAR